MNRTGDIATRGRVLFTDYCMVPYAQKQRFSYTARVVLARSEVDCEVAQRAETAWVPSPYVLRLLIHTDCDDMDPVLDEQIVLDKTWNDASAIHMAISRYNELVASAPVLIAAWRVEQGIDQQEEQ